MAQKVVTINKIDNFTIARRGGWKLEGIPHETLSINQSKTEAIKYFANGACRS